MADIDYSRIEWILCDLGRVLINFDHGLAAKSVIDHARRTKGDAFASNLSPLHLYNFLFQSSGVDSGKSIFLYHSEEKEPSRNVLLEIGARDLDWLAAEIETHLGMPITVDELDKYWNDIFLNANKENFAAMRRARANGTKVAIASNTTRSHWEFVLRTYSEMNDFYDRAFLSFELGCLKTRAEFFHQVMANTGAAPDQHLFIDDMKENLVEPASLGIQTIHFTDKLPDSPLWR